MSYNSLFGNSSHPRTNIHNDPVKANLGPKLNDVRDRQHAQQEIPIFDVNNSIIYQPVSTYGASLLDTTSLADLRTQILESNEEAIRMVPADGLNEINFYTSGTGASNLRMQIKDSSIDLLNNVALNVNDLTVGLNKSLIADYVGSRNGENLRLRRESSVYQEFTASGISINTNMFSNADGTLDIGSVSNKFNEIYSNNIRAHTSLYASQIRPYSGSNVHFHSTSISMDTNQILNTDKVYSTASNKDLFLGTGTTDKIILRHSTPIEIFDSVVIGSPSSGLIDLGTAGNPFGYVYTTTLSAAANVSTGSVTAADVEASVSIITRGNNSYISVEDDTATNGKVQIISENSATYTGYLSFIKNNIRQLFIGYNNSLQFENGSNFVIRSDQQKYLNFIHDATPANRQIQISCDLLGEFDGFYDLGSATYRFSQIHGMTINAGMQVTTNQIASYDANEIVNVNSVLRPATNNARTLGDGTNRWSEVYATNGTINTSDRNNKTDITPIKNALEFVRRLKPVQYKWIENSHGRVHTGFIAQDVLSANPLNIGSNWGGYIDTKGNGLGLRYSEFISVNTQAIKELDEKFKVLAIRLNNVGQDETAGGEIKVDLNYHTDSDEIMERLEILENRELTPIVEECDHSKLEEEIKNLKIENKKQEDCISQLIADNMILTDKLNMLMERFEKFVEDKPNVELKIVDNSDMILSETGNEDHMEMIEGRLHAVETKLTKVENKQKKLVTVVNKLNKHN